MSSRVLLIVIVSLLLILGAECIGRPPWPGSGDPSKDRTGTVDYYIDLMPDSIIPSGSQR